MRGNRTSQAYKGESSLNGVNAEGCEAGGEGPLGDEQVMSRSHWHVYGKA